jgi:hypothetical protein
MGYEAGECAFSTDKMNLGVFDFVWNFWTGLAAHSAAFWRLDFLWPQLIKGRC